MGSNPKNRVERRHRVEPAVESVLVFVEVGLQVVVGDGSVVRAHDPRLQIRDDQMHHWQMGVGLFWVAVQRHAFVDVSERLQRGVSSEGIPSHRGFRGDIIHDELRASERAAVRDYAEPQATRAEHSFERLASLMLGAALGCAVFAVLA